MRKFTKLSELALTKVTLTNYVKHMNKRVVFFSFTVLALCACAENSDQATPDGAMNQLRDAVLTNDAAKVLTLSSKKTRQLLQDILRLARKQDDVFRRKYPPE